MLPARIKAINYDQGGEGVAFHRTRPLPAKTRYRPDDFAIVPGNDVGGDCVLGDLRAGEWMRYTIDCGHGGWFDLAARVASAQGGGRLRVVALDRIVATIDVPATGGDDVWRDVVIPAAYLNPGDVSLMLGVDRPGFRFNALTFARTAHPPTLYPAVRAFRTGVAEIVHGGGSTGDDAIRNFGRKGTSLTRGLVAPRPGAAILRFVYRNHTGKPLPFELQVGETAAQPLTLGAKGDTWRMIDVKVPLEAGANRVRLTGLGAGWDSITLDHLELVMS